MCKRDPIEKTQEYKKAMKIVKILAYYRFFFSPRPLGFCHKYWAFQKRILMNWFGIDWKTPQEMNPGIRFD